MLGCASIDTPISLSLLLLIVCSYLVWFYLGKMWVRRKPSCEPMSSFLEIDISNLDFALTWGFAKEYPNLY